MSVSRRFLLAVLTVGFVFGGSPAGAEESPEKPAEASRDAESWNLAAEELSEQVEALFVVPDVPAAVALGVSTDQVARPTTLIDAAASVVTLLTPSGDVRPGVAAEIAPFGLALAPIATWAEWRGTSYWRRLAESIRISFASVEDPEVDDEAAAQTLFGVGLRLSLVDTRNPLTDTDLYDTVHAATARALDRLGGRRLLRPSAGFGPATPTVTDELLEAAPALRSDLAGFAVRCRAAGARAQSEARTLLDAARPRFLVMKAQRAVKVLADAAEALATAADGLADQIKVRTVGGDASFQTVDEWTEQIATEAGALGEAWQRLELRLDAFATAAVSAPPPPRAGQLDGDEWAIRVHEALSAEVAELQSAALGFPVRAEPFFEITPPASSEGPVLADMRREIDQAFEDKAGQGHILELAAVTTFASEGVLGGDRGVDWRSFRSWLAWHWAFEHQLAFGAAFDVTARDVDQGKLLVDVRGGLRLDLGGGTTGVEGSVQLLYEARDLRSGDAAHGFSTGASVRVRVYGDFALGTSFFAARDDDATWTTALLATVDFAGKSTPFEIYESP